MYYNHLSCVITKGGALPTSVKNQLVVVASKMAIQRKNSAKLRSGNAEGTISTDFKHRSIGSLVGIEFKSVVETVTGTSEFVFLLTRIMSEEEITKCKWVDPLTFIMSGMMNAQQEGKPPTYN